jgi:hypothetical protein
MPKITRRLTLLAAFTAALLLTSSMTPVSRAAAQVPVSERDAPQLNAFFSSKYKACDADLLSQLWLTELAEAKVRIGRMILAHQENEVEAALKTARGKRMRCMSGLNFNDASRVAALWTMPAGE